MAVMAGKTASVELVVGEKVVKLDHGVIVNVSHNYAVDSFMETEIVIRGFNPVTLAYSGHVNSYVEPTELFITEHVWACQHCAQVNTVYDHYCQHCGATPPLVPDVLKRLRVPEIKRLLG